MSAKRVLVLYYIPVVIYRLTLHPLAKYPGVAVVITEDLQEFQNASESDRVSESTDQGDQSMPLMDETH